jgi:hypothetical protein
MKIGISTAFNTRSAVLRLKKDESEFLPKAPVTNILLDGEFCSIKYSNNTSRASPVNSIKEMFEKFIPSHSLNKFFSFL